MTGWLISVFGLGCSCAASKVARLSATGQIRFIFITFTLLEYALGNHGMDAFGAVHGLRDVEIHGDARESIGVFAAEVLFCDQEVDGFPRGVNRGLVEIGIEPHGDPVRGSLAAGP